MSDTEIQELNELGAKIKEYERIPPEGAWMGGYRIRDGKSFKILTDEEWSPATDIGQAFEVLLKFKESGWSYCIEETPSVSSILNGARVILLRSIYPPSSIIEWNMIQKHDKSVAIADTPALAVMRAVREATK